MAGTNFPTSLDDNSSMPAPGPGDAVATVDHAAQHDTVNAAAKAIEAKVGTGASTPTASKVLRGTGTGTSSWAQVNLTTDVTGTLPVANGGIGQTSLTNLPLTTPLISSITNSGTITLPTGNDTLVGRATTDTLTNKTIAANASPTMTLNSNPVWQYLGSAKYTAGTVTSSGATPTLITNLTVNVTIPTGATAVEITVQTNNIYIQSGAAVGNLGIYSGASSGALTTLLNTSSPNIPSGSALPGNCVALVTSPSSSSIWYSAAIWSGASNARIDSSSTAPATLIVKCC